MKKGNISKRSKIVEMTLIHPNAAGIDIGDTLHSVAVPVGRDTECARNFGAFTCDLAAIVEWLKKCRINTIAIESTGVYWKNLHSMLIQNDIEVYLDIPLHKKVLSVYSFTKTKSKIRTRHSTLKMSRSTVTMLSIKT